MSYPSWWGRRLCRVLVQVGGVLGPALVPPAHIAVLYHFWRKYARRVDKRYCSCSCWDTVFKGSYESGIASYKHVYFNATKNSAKIWILTVIFIIAFYEAICYLATLLINRRLRYSMLILFISAIFSHYYSWWIYVNYWNDDYYSQWNHQMVFTVTELVSTVLVLLLANKSHAFSHYKALAVSVVGLSHIIAGGWDQFVLNVVRGEGRSHQIVRDINLMLPDILHFLVPIYEMQRHCNRSVLSSLFCGATPNDLKREGLLVFLFVIFAFFICSLF
ncbi:uncharacterized protein LOC120352734 [Nilaparvata lugens]|uniref:uncharacterized protein LOC120352734 n=1 Tax=Nilaparvata lugens TaxID=108931 RepID=UPI000B994818|nr:uncharacterized protein LOC120352734 [Nilaparvata lugens]